MSNKPIGVFDSGLGGLTVLREIVDMLPYENLIYFGDTARVPYGPKTEEEIKAYTFQAINFFVSKDVKAIVIACNTATARALDEAKSKYDIPIIGVIEAGVRTAVKDTNSNIIGVIGTEGTINSRAYEKELGKVNPKIKVVSKACPMFVPIIEEGWSEADVAYTMSERYLGSVKDNNVDSLILGCTHYPHMKKVIREVMGPNVKLVDPAKETVVDLKMVLAENSLLINSQERGMCTYYVSGSSKKFGRIAKELMNLDIENVNSVNINEY